MSQLEILAFLRKNPGGKYTRQELSKELNKGLPTITTQLVKLYNWGFCARTIIKKKPHYYNKEK